MRGAMDGKWNLMRRNAKLETWEKEGGDQAGIIKWETYF